MWSRKDGFGGSWKGPGRFLEGSGKGEVRVREGSKKGLWEIL